MDCPSVNVSPMRTRWIVIIALIAGCGFATREAFSQRVRPRTPFFGGGNTGFDPEISVVNSGALLDAQVVVSDDRKYVTINARPSNSSLLALRDFQFQTGGGNVPRLGFVGGAGNNNNNNAPGVNAVNANVLERPGMNRISGLD